MPDLLCLGDSHTIALRQGAEDLGLATDGQHWSGAAWHAAKFEMTDHGPAPVGTPRAREKFDEYAARLGNPAKRVPTITTLGFHLGRLVPPFGWNDHVAHANGAPWSEDETSVSRAFLRDYIWAYRARHIRTAKAWAKIAPLVIVAPPPAFDRPSYAAFRAEIVSLMREASLTVFDPAILFEDNNGTVPPDLLEDDGLHGTVAYGARVIEALRSEGHLPNEVAA